MNPLCGDIKVQQFLKFVNSDIYIILNMSELFFVFFPYEMVKVIFRFLLCQSLNNIETSLHYSFLQQIELSHKSTFDFWMYHKVVLGRLRPPADR